MSEIDSERLSFPRPTRIDQSDVSPDQRQAQALEYIAYYLDRIEAHLAVIAHSLTAYSTEGFTIMRALQDIAEARKSGRD